MATACVALGSNMGDRSRHLRDAAAAIAALPGVAGLRQAGVYETEPVGGPAGQERFLNSAVRVETTLPPEVLLARLLEVERAAGRPRRDERVHWGPRPLDLDLLLYDDRVIDLPGITIPHPRLHERAFVLIPLADIAPELKHPVLRRTIHELLYDLENPTAPRRGLSPSEAPDPGSSRDRSGPSPSAQDSASPHIFHHRP